jgi:hypothetical protein
MMEEMFERYHQDMESLHRMFLTQPCFVCRILAGKNERPQHFVHEDEKAIAFLDTFPGSYRKFCCT